MLANFRPCPAGSSKMIRCELALLMRSVLGLGFYSRLDRDWIIAADGENGLNPGDLRQQVGQGRRIADAVGRDFDRPFRTFSSLIL